MKGGNVERCSSGNYVDPSGAESTQETSRGAVQEAVQEVILLEIKH